MTFTPPPLYLLEGIERLDDTSIWQQGNPYTSATAGGRLLLFKCHCIPLLDPSEVIRQAG